MIESLVWNYTADEIISRADRLIESTTAIFDDIASIPLSNVNFENILKAIANSDCDFAVTR